jgi:hypothetical protein
MPRNNRIRKPILTGRVCTATSPRITAMAPRTPGKANPGLRISTYMASVPSEMSKCAICGWAI